MSESHLSPLCGSSTEQPWFPHGTSSHMKLIHDKLYVIVEGERWWSQKNNKSHALYSLDGRRGADISCRKIRSNHPQTEEPSTAYTQIVSLWYTHVDSDESVAPNRAY
jgi:hypothetical protein